MTLFQLSCEQQDEEQLLRKGRDEAIAKLKADINKEREEMERGLRGLLETSMSDLRRQLDKEREEERERVKAECVGGVTRYRQQLMEETNKVGVALGHMTNTVVGVALGHMTNTILWPIMYMYNTVYTLYCGHHWDPSNCTDCRGVLSSGV